MDVEGVMVRVMGLSSCPSLWEQASMLPPRAYCRLPSVLWMVAALVSLVPAARRAAEWVVLGTMPLWRELMGW